MTTIRYNDNWVQFNSHENQCFDYDEEEEQEALSLCDLPTNNHQTETNSNKEDNDQEDFEFGSGHANASFRSPENMCNVDELFFRGQILPLRNSVSSVSAISDRSNENDPKMTRWNGSGYRVKPRIRNQFHSHPSPSPQIRTQSCRTFSRSKSKTTSLWSFLQVGLVKPQEIGLSDLKNRSKRSGSYNSNSSSNSDMKNRSKRSGSYNSNSSNNSNSNSNNNSSSINSLKDQNQNKRKSRNNMKKKQRLFLGGCNCAVDSIERTIKETVVSKERPMVGEGRQTASRHRTFEWLKQLSIAAPSEVN